MGEQLTPRNAAVLQAVIEANRRLGRAATEREIWDVYVELLGGVNHG